MSEPQPAEMLAELDQLRRRTRRDRHAFWFPLVAFGVAILVVAPVYALLRGPSLLTSVALLCTLLIAAWLTTRWYRAWAERTGLRTPIEGSRRAWVIAGIVLFLSPFLPFVFFIWPLWVRGLAGLLAVAIGLTVLARAERSTLLWCVTVVYWGVAAMGTFYDPANLISGPVRAIFKLSWEEMPYELLSATNVVLPALVLLVGGLVAYLNGRRTA